jgi:parvulin-like peptidyl-prolyl isomerase
MADTNETSTNNSSENAKKLNKKKLSIAIAILVVLVLGLYLARGIFVVAFVNGKPITRLSVIKQLEKQGGKQALEAMIEQKVVEDIAAKSGANVSKEQVDEEIKKIEDQVTEQGEKLEEVLKTEDMTIEKLREQITIQKKIEGILADKIKVSDEEVNNYIKESGITPKEGMKEEDFRKEIKTQMERQKFQMELQTWIGEQVKQAKVKYFKQY